MSVLRVGKKIHFRPVNLGEYGFQEFTLDAYRGRPELMAIDPSKKYKMIIMEVADGKR